MFKRLCHIDAINQLPLTNVPDVIGLNGCTEIAYNKQYIEDVWNRLSNCTTFFEGSYEIQISIVFIS